MAQSGTIVYSGRFEHTLDDKNRLTVPSAWRWSHTDSEKVLAIPQPDGYNAVLTPARVAKMLTDISESKISDSEAQAVKARIFSEAMSFTFDKQGRFGITADLLRHAGHHEGRGAQRHGRHFQHSQPGSLGGDETRDRRRSLRRHDAPRWTLINHEDSYADPFANRSQNSWPVFSANRRSLLREPMCGHRSWWKKQHARARS